MAEYLQHVVKSGETLGKIAVKNNTTVGELVALNGLSNPDLIREGQILNIRRVSNTKYIVRKGDSLSVIAAHYGVSVEALAVARFRGQRVSTV
jgi:LysM repeat protein